MCFPQTQLHQQATLVYKLATATATATAATPLKRCVVEVDLGHRHTHKLLKKIWQEFSLVRLDFSRKIQREKCCKFEGKTHQWLALRATDFSYQFYIVWFCLLEARNSAQSLKKKFLVAWLVSTLVSEAKPWSKFFKFFIMDFYETNELKASTLLANFYFWSFSALLVKFFIILKRMIEEHKPCYASLTCCGLPVPVAEDFRFRSPSSLASTKLFHNHDPSCPLPQGNQSESL